MIQNGTFAHPWSGLLLSRPAMHAYNTTALARHGDTHTRAHTHTHTHTYPHTNTHTHPHTQGSLYTPLIVVCWEVRIYRDQDIMYTLGYTPFTWPTVTLSRTSLDVNFKGLLLSDGLVDLFSQHTCECILQNRATSHE